MKRWTIIVGCAAGCLVTVLAGAFGAVGAAAGQPSPPSPPGDTVVAVQGDADSGFTIVHHDGSQLSPPTTSESMAECGEYDTLRQRVSCRTEVRTWYRELAVLQQALEWAQH